MKLHIVRRKVRKGRWGRGKLTEVRIFNRTRFLKIKIRKRKDGRTGREKRKRGVAPGFQEAFAVPGPARGRNKKKKGRGGEGKGREKINRAKVCETSTGFWGGVG